MFFPSMFEFMVLLNAISEAKVPRKQSHIPHKGSQNLELVSLCIDYPITNVSSSDTNSD